MDQRGSTSTTNRLANGLGAFSLALGTAQLVAPDAMTRLVGARSTARNRAVQRWLGGMREVTAGTGLLATRHPGWLWARVVGDVFDLTALARGPLARPPLARTPLTQRRKDSRRRGTIALASVAVVTAADVMAASRRTNGAEVGAAARITVNRPVTEVYEYWRKLENLPTFMTHLTSVEEIDGGRSRWTASGPAGVDVTWEAEITDVRPDEFIEWRSTDDATVRNSGRVEFRPAPGDRGTEVRVRLGYEPPGGKSGAAVAKLLGEEPNQQIRDDLRRFKQILEVGEVVRSQGSPEGTDVRRLIRQRPAAS